MKEKGCFSKKRAKTAAMEDGPGCGTSSDALPDIEKEREETTRRNEEMLALIGLKKIAADLRQLAPAVNKQHQRPNGDTQEPAAKKARKVADARQQSSAPRRSGRIAGRDAPELDELDDRGLPVRRPPASLQAAKGGAGGEEEEEDEEEGEYLNLLEVELVEQADGQQRPQLTGAAAVAAGAAAAEPGARNSRGGAYRRGVGGRAALSCHFCRQCRVCDEPGCPRCCGKGDASKDCVGKTKCTGCSQPHSMLCRGCLLTRYGQDLDKARADPEWRCPHCWEEKDGGWQEHGWFCNTSFCMHHKKLAHTGIAIGVARSEGFASAAHLVQAKWLAHRQAVAAAAAAADGSAAGAATNNSNSSGAAAVSDRNNGKPGSAEEGGVAADAAAPAADSNEVAAAITTAGGDEPGVVTTAAAAAGSGDKAAPEAGPAPGDGGDGNDREEEEGMSLQERLAAVRRRRRGAAAPRGKAVRVTAAAGRSKSGAGLRGDEDGNSKGGELGLQEGGEDEMVAAGVAAVEVEMGSPGAAA